MAAITVSDLTAGEDSLKGTGTFDELMRAVEAHIEREYKQGRIKGNDYATVYLGALQSVMDRSLQFILQKQRADLEAQLLQEQIETEGLNQQIRQQELLNLQSEKLQTEAQTALIGQQETNLVAEGLNIPKQGALIDSQKARQDQEVLNLKAQELQTDAQTALINQQQTNAVTENATMVKEQAKLDAEVSLIGQQETKTVSETALLDQKKLTETAQVDGSGITEDSILGKQRELYENQALGFIRDAEQRAAKIMAETYSVRHSMDSSGTPANADNKLQDAYIGQAITKLLQGVGGSG